MAAETKIEWAHHTWNPWRGCEHATLPDGTAHPGCFHCYAETMSRRNPATLGTWGGAAEGGVRVVAAHDYWRLPEKWQREAIAASERRRVFCASLADVFEDWRGAISDRKRRQLFRDGDEFFVPGNGYLGIDPVTIDDLRRRAFEAIDETPDLDWLILTKRPENVKRMWPPRLADGDGSSIEDWTTVRRNVWILTSVSDQKTAEALIPPLLECRDMCPVIGLSIEPLLGHIWLKGPGCQWCYNDGVLGLDSYPCPACFGIDWAIIGCESNSLRVGSLGSFRSEAEWWAGCQSLVERLRAGRVPVFIKQVPIQGRVSHDPAEWPEWARVREFPEVTLA